MKQDKHICLIDSDISVYRVGFASEDESEGIAIARMDTHINEILDAMECDEFYCFLSPTDKSNFRYQVDPEYKANRKQPKPRHYEALREHLINDYQANIADGQEADDAMAIKATKIGDDAIICTIDKDLDMIPGWHFNWVQGRKYNISNIEACRSFYHQLLEGDSTDNIKGCPKIGKIKAQRILEGCQNEKELMEAVVNCYTNAFPENEWADRLLHAAKLLWIRKEPEQTWTTLSGEVVSKISLATFYENMMSSSDTNQT